MPLNPTTPLLTRYFKPSFYGISVPEVETSNDIGHEYFEESNHSEPLFAEGFSSSNACRRVPLNRAFEASEK